MNKIFRGKNILYTFLLFCIIVFTQCAGNLDVQLEKMAKKSNLECPKMLDQWTRLDSCAAYPGKNYKYFHTIVNNGFILDADKFETNFKPVIISMIKTNTAMKFFRENEVVLHYQYTDEVKKTQMVIVVTPDDYKK